MILICIPRLETRVMNRWRCSHTQNTPDVLPYWVNPTTHSILLYHPYNTMVIETRRVVTQNRTREVLTISRGLTQKSEMRMLYSSKNAYPVHGESCYQTSQDVKESTQILLTLPSAPRTVQTTQHNIVCYLHPGRRELGSKYIRGEASWSANGLGYLICI